MKLHQAVGDKDRKKRNKKRSIASGFMSETLAPCDVITLNWRKKEQKNKNI